jgi:hypothetical protein
VATYEILQNKLIDFATMQKMRRFARYWDLVANSGNFVETTPLIWKDAQSPFNAFMRWSEWFFARIGRQHSISLASLAESLLAFLTSQIKLDPQEVGQTIWRDYQRGGRYDVPGFLQPHLPPEMMLRRHSPRPDAPKRQQRHLQTATE